MVATPSAPNTAPPAKLHAHQQAAGAHQQAASGGLPSASDSLSEGRGAAVPRAPAMDLQQWAGHVGLDKLRTAMEASTGHGCYAGCPDGGDGVADRGACLAGWLLAPVVLPQRHVAGEGRTEQDVAGSGTACSSAMAAAGAAAAGTASQQPVAVDWAALQAASCFHRTGEAAATTGAVSGLSPAGQEADGSDEPPVTDPKHPPGWHEWPRLSRDELHAFLAAHGLLMSTHNAVLFEYMGIAEGITPDSAMSVHEQTSFKQHFMR